MKILMLHGINHNMFGKRDPKQYGTITLAQIDAQLQSLGKELLLSSLEEKLNACYFVFFY